MELPERLSCYGIRYLLEVEMELVDEEYRAHVTAILSNTLRGLQDDLVNVQYHRKYEVDGRGVGRLYSQDSTGSAMLWRVFRGALYRYTERVCGVRLQDWDVQAAHPVFHSQECARHGIKVPCADRYLADREGWLQRLQADTDASRGDCKNLFNSLLNFGKVSTWVKKHSALGWSAGSDTWKLARGYEKEAVSSVKRLKEVHPGLYAAALRSLEDDKRNGKLPSDHTLTQEDKLKRFQHVLMTHLEDQVLMAIVEYADRTDGVTPRSLQYDGLVVELRGDAEFDPDAASEHVLAATGFRVKLTNKAFDSSLTIPDWAPVLLSGSRDTVAEYLYSHSPGEFDRLRWDTTVNKMFCHDEFNVWRQCSDSVPVLAMERAAKSCALRTERCLAAANKEFWRGQKPVAEILMREHCLADGFDALLDSSETIFPFNNSCYDFSTQSVRPIVPSDYVTRTSCWDYEPGQDQSFIALFMEQLFPMEEERMLVATYIGYILNPRKPYKCAMFFTDEMLGNNGKSKLLHLIKMLLGAGASGGDPLFTEQKKLFLKDAQTSKSGHDAGLCALKGMHLLCGDEFTGADKLDAGFFKEACGGDQGSISGRHFNSNASFCFRIKFAMLCVFNEKCMPNMNSDEVLYRRLHMAQFRTKFISRAPGETDEELAERASEYDHWHEADKDISHKLRAHLSSAFDYFVAQFTATPHLLEHPPASCVAFRNRIVGDDNPLTDWFEKNFEKTDDEKESVQLCQIDNFLGQSRAGMSLLNEIRPLRRRRNLFQQVLERSGLRVHKKHRSSGLNNIAFGVRFTPQPDPES